MSNTNFDKNNINIKELECDLLIIGGGTTGCHAGIYGKDKNKDLNIIIIEKASIERSGCLAAGVNAINAYLRDEENEEDYYNFVKKESHNLVRKDLVLSIGKKLNSMAHKLDDYGVIFHRDENNKYVFRGRRSVKINGENIKPILAKKVREKNITVLEKTTALDYILDKDLNNKNKVVGVYAISNDLQQKYMIKAKTVLCATGGASGLYNGNNPQKSKNKTWYSPFNTGDGLAMGIRSGAEMTTFEMRFIALRTKDTISPTGTIAQGINAKQINKFNEEYLDKYKIKNTPMRLYATIKEYENGNGPCYLNTNGIDETTELNLKKAYLNMSPSILLKWHNENIDIKKGGIEICGSEPYINGGHGQSGYWVDENRETTVENLYAGGDNCGGSPKKYVTGCMAEGEIAVEDILNKLNNIKFDDSRDYLRESKEYFSRFNINKNNINKEISPTKLLKTLKNIMDKYVGGISQNYRVNKDLLTIGRDLLKDLETKLDQYPIKDSKDILKREEVRNKILLGKVLIEHLLYRKETRWPCYQEREDYPNLNNEEWFKFINSKWENGTISMIEREVQDEY